MRSVGQKWSSNIFAHYCIGKRSDNLIGFGLSADRTVTQIVHFLAYGLHRNAKSWTLARGGGRLKTSAMRYGLPLEGPNALSLCRHIMPVKVNTRQTHGDRCRSSLTINIVHWMTASAAGLPFPTSLANRVYLRNGINSL